MTLLVAWGQNDSGECCDAEREERTVKQPSAMIASLRLSVGRGVRVTSVASGESHSLLLTECGEVFACGRAKEGQLGLGGPSAGLVVRRPTLVEALQPWHMAMVSCGVKHSCAIATSGAAFEWGLLLPEERFGGNEDAEGRRLRGGLGRDFEEDLDQRQRRIVAESWSLYLKNDDGEGEELDALALMSAHERRRRATWTPRACEGLQCMDIRSLACGYAHTIVAVADGSLWASGYNEKGQLGNGTRMPSAQFQPVRLPDGVAHSFGQADRRGNHGLLACGLNHTAVISDPMGQVVTWGLGTFGQLALGKAEKERCLPGVVSGLGSPAVQLACGDHHTVILTAAGALWASGHRDALGGRSHHGRLPERQAGLGSDFDQPVERLFAGGMGSFALVCPEQDGLPRALHAWGYNQKQHLGRAGAFDARELLRPMPVSLPRLPGSTLQDFSAGQYHSLALLSEPAVAVLAPELGEAPTANDFWREALRNGSGADVEVWSRGTAALPAHRCMLLARAPGLAARLRELDAARWELDLRQFSSACVSALLEYLYGDFCLAAPAVAAELGPLAQELGLARLAIGTGLAVQTRSIDDQGAWVRGSDGKWRRVEDAARAEGPGGAASTYAADLGHLVREIQEDTDLEPDGVRLLLRASDGSSGSCVSAPRPLLRMIEFFRVLLEEDFADAARGGDSLKVAVESPDALVACLRVVATGDRAWLPAAPEEQLAVVLESDRLCLPGVSALAELALSRSVADLGDTALLELADLAELHGLHKLRCAVSLAQGCPPSASVFSQQK